MRTQLVDYAVLNRKYDRSETGLPGYSGFTDKARFIFHVGITAFLFGKHEGRTLVVEFLTTGFFLRFRLEQTVTEGKPDTEVDSYRRPYTCDVEQCQSRAMPHRKFCENHE